MNEKMGQLVANCFINALWWTKCFPAGGVCGADLIGRHPPHSSGPSSLPNVPPSAFPLSAFILFHASSPPPMCPAPFSPGLTGSMTHQVVPLNPPGTKCAKLDGKFLHQEGREIANFPWCGGGVWVGGIVDEKHCNFLGYKQREKRKKCKSD